MRQFWSVADCSEQLLPNLDVECDGDRDFPVDGSTWRSHGWARCQHELYG